MTASITLTFATFARDLGAAARITRDASLVWYKQYGKADAVTRKALREEFVLNFLTGYYKAGKNASPEVKAAKVMALSRTERSTEDENAYRAAGMKFKYHVVRDHAEGKRSKAAPVSPVEKLLKEFAGLTAAQRRAFLAKAASL